MFTGIVDHCGKVVESGHSQAGVRLLIETHFKDLVEGESVSVDGACLTALSPSEGRFWCDVSPETLRLTVVELYKPGARVNVERALRLSDRLGGHLVTGHVDLTARLSRRTDVGEFIHFFFGGIPEVSMRYLFPKGSVAVQGVSLTVNAVFPGGFEVMVVPHTLERTNLNDLNAGDRANIEFDWMTKVVLNEAKRLELINEYKGR